MSRRKHPPSIQYILLSGFLIFMLLVINTAGNKLSKEIAEIDREIKAIDAINAKLLEKYNVLISNRINEYIKNGRFYPAHVKELKRFE